MKPLKTTLILIPGGEELARPENADILRTALRTSLFYRTSQIIMLGDEPVIPERELHKTTKYKTVLLIASDAIGDEEDAFRLALEMQSDNYLPVIVEAGFDFQVIQMEEVAVRYEDFEILEKFL